MGHELVLMVIRVNLKDLVRAVHIRLFSCLFRAKVEEVKGEVIEGRSPRLIHVGHIKCVLVIW